MLSVLRARARGRLAGTPAIVWVATVAAVSAVAGGGSSWVVALAASPDRIREGKLWFLFSSALLVDHPVVVSVLSFAALALLAWLICRERVFWLSAFLGQVGATLIVYLFIGIARWLVAGAYPAAVASPDYGVSTVSAAWLGSIATVAWRARGRSRKGKLSILASCIAVGLFAYGERPDLTVLSSEHLVAFAFGVGIAIPGLARALFARCVQKPSARAARALERLGVREANRAAVTLTAVVVAIAVVAAPAALGTLRTEIALHLAPTLSRCANNWNRLVIAPWSDLPPGPVRYVSLTVARAKSGAAFNGRMGKPGSRRTYCRYAFASRSRAMVVLGLWRHGRVIRWSVENVQHAPGPVPGNATLDTDGRIRLDRRRARLTLSS